MIAGCRTFGVVIFVSVMALMFLPLTTESLWMREVLNSGHTVFFFFLSFYAYHGLKNHTSISKTYLIVVVVVFVGILLGVLIEMLQIPVQREASVDDLYRDVAGIFAGLCLVAAGTAKKVYRVICLLSAAGLMWLALAPLAQLSVHYIQRNSDFPVVIDLGAKWAGSFIEYDYAELIYGGYQDEKDKLRQVVFGPGRFPGISVSEPVADWSAYQRLKFSVVSNSESVIIMVLRINDKWHNQEYSDRFNRKIIVHPGLNEYVITLDSIRAAPDMRELDLSQIAGIILFLSQQSSSVTLSIGNLYLE